MPRRPRHATAGLVFHVMNRAVRRITLFARAQDYDAFVDVLREAQDRVPLRLLCFAVMPNHWHLVVWPHQDDQLSRFMARLTGTHARRWNVHRAMSGVGAVYQGRYKAIPVKDDHHLLVVCRYVERNPVKAGLVARAADWPWSSAALARIDGPEMSAWPTPRPEQWNEYVDRGEFPGEFEPLREAIRSATPFGPSGWRRDSAATLAWPNGLRPRGRPPGP